MQKNRRNVKGFGCMGEMNQGFWYLEMMELKIEDICWQDADMVEYL